MRKEKLSAEVELVISIEREYKKERVKETVAWITRQLKLALTNSNFKIEQFKITDWGSGLEREPEEESEEESESPD